jgi:hypothetical protein
MIYDDNLISIDNAALSGTITPVAVPLTSLKKPGREEPIAISVKMTEAAAGGTSVAIKLQQCDTATGTFADVPGSSATVLLAAMTKGANIYLRWLPAGVTKPWIKVVVTATGTFTAGKIMAAVVREDDLPYEAGLYIDKGRVIG